MRTVVFAGTKGGCGRSTLAFNISLEATKTHSVLLADVDPQRSLTELIRRRGEERNPRLMENVSSVVELLARFRGSTRERDYLVVDTPGANMSILADAVTAADVLVLPVQPSPIDLIAQGAICDLIDKLGKTDRTIFALNRVDPRSDLGPQSVGWLIKNFGFPVVEIRQRSSYPKAAIIGSAAGEIDRGAAREMAELWSKIQEKAR